MSNIANLGNFPHTIGNLDDRPNLTAAQMKAAFEQDVMTLWGRLAEAIPYINDMLPASKLVDIVNSSSTDDGVPTAKAVYDAIADASLGGSAQQIIDDWLDAHPEATTTVTDGSITNAKLASTFVTPGVASDYVSNTSYPAGSYVFHGGALYTNPEDVSDAVWTSAHWKSVFLGNDVSDLKRSVNNNEGVSIIDFDKGYYIKTNQGIGETVNFTHQTNSTMASATVDCTAGDLFTIKGYGGNAGRLWCFIDSSNKILSVSGSSANENNIIIKAPTNAAKLIINSGISVNPCAVKGVIPSIRMTNSENDLNFSFDYRYLASDQIRLNIAAYLTNSGEYTQGIDQSRCASVKFIPVKKNDKIVIADGYALRIAFYSSDDVGTFTSLVGFNITGEYAITSDCYIRISMKRMDETNLSSTDIANAFTIQRGSTSRNVKEVRLYDGHIEYPCMYIDEDYHQNFSYRMGISDYIDAEENELYRIELEYDDTNDGTASVNRFVYYNSDREEIGNYTITLGGDNQVTTYKSFIVTPTGTRYIRVSYAVKNTNYFYILAYCAVDAEARKNNSAEEKNIKTIQSEKYAIKKNDPALVEQMIAIAKSYGNQKDSGGNYIMHYGNRTPLDDNYENDNSIDCSCFLGFVLRGVSFSDSPYTPGNDSPSYDDDHGDDTDNESGNTGNYDPTVWTRNPKYLWSTDPGQYDIELNHGLYYSDQEKYNSLKRVRRAGQLAELFATQGREIPIDDKLNNIEPGDFVFWSRKRLNGNWVQPMRFRYIDHIGMIIKKEKATEDDNWDITKHPWKHTYIAVGTGNATTDVVRTGTLEKEGSERDVCVGTLSFVARPDLGSILAVTEKTNDDTEYPGLIKYDSDYLYICLGTGSWKKVPLQSV